MKRTIPYIVAAFLAAGGLTPVFVFAETATSTPVTRPGIRQERDDLRETAKIRMQEIHNSEKEQRKKLQDEMQMRFRELKGGSATTTPMMRRDILEKVHEEREQIREEAKEKRGELREEVKKQREEIKLKVAEQIARRVREHFDRMLKRFDAAIERLEKLADRIESRLDKAAENGKEVTTLRAKLDTARVKIAEAQTALDEAVVKFEEILGMDNPREAFKEVQTIMNNAKDKIKAAHAALVDVINSLKGIGNTVTTTPGGNATTTPAVLP